MRFTLKYNAFVSIGGAEARWDLSGQAGELTLVRLHLTLQNWSLLDLSQIRFPPTSCTPKALAQMHYRALFLFLLLFASATAFFTPPRPSKFGEKAPHRSAPKTSTALCQYVSRNVLGGDLQCCCANVRDSGIGTGKNGDVAKHSCRDAV